MSTLNRAIALAARAHEGQFDKAGASYILHPLRLMLRQPSPEGMMVAVLHDVIEDTDVSLADLRAEGFPPAVVEAVAALTRQPQESYEAFIQRIAPNPLARRVKLADLEDNLDLRRLEALQGHDLERARRYHAAWRYLSLLEGEPATDWR